jgi:hypothetical protein
MVKQQIGQRGRRKRDYRKEYERRVQRGLAKGLSLSQARGHARPTEAPVSRKAISFEQWSRVLELAVARMREGDSLTSAARIASDQPGTACQICCQDRHSREVQGPLAAPRRYPHSGRAALQRWSLG